MPTASIAHTALSREEPQPKLRHQDSGPAELRLVENEIGVQTAVGAPAGAHEQQLGIVGREGARDGSA
jgi:hypothetical protein